MLDQYPAEPHLFIPGATRRSIPLPNGHKLSVIESSNGYEIALLNPSGSLMSHPIFFGDEVLLLDKVEEVVDIIDKLAQELA